MPPRLVVALSLLAPLCLAQEAGPSRISHVVVYPRSAEVTREREVEASVGPNRVVFDALVANLDPASLRASSDEGVEVVGIEARTRFLTEPLSKALADLDARIREAARRLKEIELELSRVEEERAFYGTIRAASLEAIREATEGRGLAIEDWEKTMRFVAAGLAAADARRLEIEDTRRQAADVLGALQEERSRVASERPREMKEVTVSIRSARAGRVAVRIHYVVPDAGWSPTYDVHLDSAGPRVRFTCYGLVTQATGEPWEAVDLTLARARGEHRIDAPETRPVLVALGAAELKRLASDIRDLNDAADAKLWIESRLLDAQGCGNFIQSVQELANQEDAFLADNGITRIELVRAIEKLQDRFSGVRYPVRKPETVPSDRSAHKIVVFSELLPARLAYVALPSAGSLVVRRAEVENTTSFPFLAGPSSVFVDGSFVGNSQVANASANESISLFFGPDEGLEVVRELVKRETKGPERFRQSQLVTWEYRIRIENFHGTEVEVELEDQIPVSQTDDVQVKFLGSNVEGVAPDEKGVLRWRLTVKARTPAVVTFRYQIEHPLAQSLSFR